MAVSKSTVIERWERVKHIYRLADIVIGIQDEDEADGAAAPSKARPKRALSVAAAPALPPPIPPKSQHRPAPPKPLTPAEPVSEPEPRSKKRPPPSSVKQAATPIVVQATYKPAMPPPHKHNAYTPQVKMWQPTPECTPEPRAGPIRIVAVPKPKSTMPKPKLAARRCSSRLAAVVVAEKVSDMLKRKHLQQIVARQCNAATTSEQKANEVEQLAKQIVARNKEGAHKKSVRRKFLD